MPTQNAMRTALAVLLVAFAAILPLHAATEYKIIQGGTGANVYASLEAFRLAGVALQNGDSIVLYNNDASLTLPLALPDNTRVTLKSSGGTYAVTGAAVTGNNIINVQGNEPQLTLENIRMTGNTSIANAVVYMRNTGGPSAANGILNIANAVFANNAGTLGTVALQGNAAATITNTVFSNNGNAASLTAANALSMTNVLGETTAAAIVIDANAPSRTVWSSGAAGGSSIAVNMNIGGTGSLDFAVAAGKTLEIRDAIIKSGTGAVELAKTGQGTLKIVNGGVGDMNLAVREGTMHFAGITDILWTGDNISISPGATFKPTIDAGNLSEVLANPNAQQSDWTATDSTKILLTGAFTAMPGARLEVGNISTLPQLGDWRNAGGGTLRKYRIAYGIVLPLDIANSSVTGLNINNELMSARLYLANSADPFAENPDPATFNSIRLEIDRLNNLATLDGIGSYADVYRLLPTLSQEERDFLDSFYARGGDDLNGMAYLQTLGGALAQNTLMAMRLNQRNLQRAIGRRFTSPAPKEKTIPAMTNATEFQRYFMAKQENPDAPDAGIWAYADKRWIEQGDYRDAAGYAYNPYGLGLGFDKKIGDFLVGGVARYDNGAMRLKAGGDSKTDIDTLLLTAYGAWTVDKYYFGGGAHFGYGWNKSKSNYAAAGMNETAHSGTYGSSLFGLSTEFGYMWDTTLGGLPFQLTPYGGAGFARIGRNGFVESGGGNLNRRFESSHWNAWDIALGFKMALPLELTSLVVIPTADISFIREMGTPTTHDNDVTLLSNPSASWRAPDLATNQSGLHLEAGLTARFGSNWDLGMNYEFEWRRKSTAHRLDFNVAKGF